MKRTLIVVLVSMLGAMSACTRDSDGGDETTPSPSSSPVPGLASHTFEGEGEDDYVDTDSVELYGQYDVEWEVTGNELEASGEPGYFEISLEGPDFAQIAASNVADGSGSEKIQVDKGTYYASVFFGPEAKWKLTFTRTCDGLPPDCPVLEE